MANRRRDILCALLFLAFGIFMFSNSLGIRPMIDKEVGSGYVPKALSLVMIVLSGLMLVLTVLNKKVGATEKTDEDVKSGVLTILALAAYVALFQVLGFLVTTAFYLFFQITILSTRQNRNLLLFAVISVLAPVIIYGIFTTLFQMPFPSGILGL